MLELYILPAIFVEVDSSNSQTEINNEIILIYLFFLLHNIS